jgi:2Fe-2S ferredoxin
MAKITFNHAGGDVDVLDVEPGTSLMRAAVTNGVAGIVGECGGQAMCATCHVYVRPEYAQALPGMGDDEDEMLDCTTAERMDSSRLACQIKIDAELPEIVVDIPAGQL